MEDDPPPEAFEPEPERPRDQSPLRRRLRAALIVLLILAMIGLAGAQALPVMIQGGLSGGPYGDARLAVVDRVGALTTVRADGGSVVSYSLEGTPFQFPAWSPDGSRLAVIGQSDQGGAVYIEAVGTVGQAATPRPTVVYESADRPPFYLYWTPDGTRVTFLTTEPDGLALRVVPADASAEASVLRTGAPMYWAFTAADRLLVHSGPSAPIGFFGEIGLDGSPIPDTEAPTGIYRAPAVSRDGKFRAFVGAEADGSAALALEARDGGGSTRLAVLGPAAFSFAPAGTALAYIAPDQAGSEADLLPIGPLRVVRPGDQASQPILSGRIVAFFWAPSGREIAALRVPTSGDGVTPVRATMRESGVREATNVREAATGFALELVFVDAANGSIRSQREVRVSGLFVNQVLPFFDQYALSHRFWSPDSGAIVLPLVDDSDVTHVVVIPADGSEAVAIAAGEMAFWSP